MHYPDTISIYRNTAAVDAGGSPLGTTITLHLDSIKSRAQEIKLKEKIAMGREKSAMAYRIYPDRFDYDITQKDTLEFDNALYDIISLSKYPNTYMKLIVVSKDG